MEEILDYIKNYFAVTKENNTFNINNGAITIRGKYLEGQYIKLEGSILNDSIYKIESVDNNTITVVGAINEEFEGAIYGLAIPKEIVELSKKFEEQKEKIVSSIYESESFGEYSYTLAKNEKGEIYGAIDTIKKELSRYRQMKDISRFKAKVI